jgi:hypothetical protein
MPGIKPGMTVQSNLIPFLAARDLPEEAPNEG